MYPNKRIKDLACKIQLMVAQLSKSTHFLLIKQGFYPFFLYSLKTESYSSKLVQCKSNTSLNVLQLFLLLATKMNQQKQPSEVFYKKDVLKHFAKFTGKHLCQSIKEILAQVFSCESYEIFTEHRTENLQKTSGWLLLNQKIYNETSQLFFLD